MKQWKPQPGDRVYKVWWRHGETPYILSGLVSRKEGARTRRVVLVLDGRKDTLQNWRPTVKGAIEEAVLEVAQHYGRPMYNFSGRARPWTIVCAVNRLSRLYRRLREHHLA